MLLMVVLTKNNIFYCVIHWFFKKNHIKNEFYIKIIWVNCSQLGK